MLTVDMLTHSFRKNMGRATLLTGDNDFKPLIDALVQDGMLVNLWYPPDETSRELIDAADARTPLTMLALHDLLLDESKARFTIPNRANLKPNSLALGEPLHTWKHSDRKQCALFHWKDYYVVKEHDSLNTLHINHPNLELLRYFCWESLHIKVPEF